MRKKEKAKLLPINVLSWVVVLFGLIYGPLVGKGGFSFLDYAVWNAIFVGALNAISFFVIALRRKGGLPRWLFLLKVAATSSSLITLLIIALASYPFYNPQASSWPSFATGSAIYLGVLVPFLSLVEYALLLKKRENLWVDALVGLAVPGVYFVVIASLKLAGVDLASLPFAVSNYIAPNQVPAYAVYLWLLGAVLLGYVFSLVLLLLAVEEEASEATVSEAEKPEGEKKTEEKASGDVRPEEPEERKVADSDSDKADEKEEKPLQKTSETEKQAENSPSKPSQKKPSPAPKKKDTDDIDVVTEEEGTEEAEMEEERKQIAEAKAKGYGEGPRVYHISKQATTGQWQVRLATGKKAIRLFKTQASAITFAKGLVKTQGGSIRVHSKKGKLRKA